MGVARKALNPSMANRFDAWLTLGLGITSLAFVGWVNVDALVEAFGDGPPYYGRTTNMDKWESPLPILAMIDIVVLVLMIPAVRWSIKSLVECLGQ